MWRKPWAMASLRLFGAPLAHEDHPQRALYAALRMQEEMRRYADTLRAKGYPPLLMRVGVNTGEVVVRSIRKEDLHTDYVPIGHSTNLPPGWNNSRRRAPFLSQPRPTNSRTVTLSSRISARHTSKG